LIYVTVGVSRGFQRLVKNADKIAESHPNEFLLQIGDTEYVPQYSDYFEVTTPKKHEQHCQNATVVVGHAGTGTLLTAMENNVRLVLFPRNPELDEVIDGHQLHHVKGWSNRLNLTVVKTAEELGRVLSSPKSVPKICDDMNDTLIEKIGDIVREESQHCQYLF
jgi:UDP-N-acetylglucosamine transferase subunit ALG13